MVRRMPEVGGVFLQGESEIAVGYMVLGAAACGERVMTSSSGPGISLMSESISYMAGSQCPAVIVNIMRTGPGLGGILPSQADYLQATKGGGHGDFRLLVLAPAGIQEAVEMVMEAFPLAEKYRNPVMILGDGLIGQMMEPVDFPDHLKSEPPDKNAWAVNGMDTRNSGTRNIIKSLSLDPDEMHAMNVTLKEKYDRMTRDEVRFETYNLESDYKVLMVSFGTMARVCRTVVDVLKEEGFPAALIRPQTLYPFPLEAISQAASKKSCELVMSIELNMGQMIEDVERAVQGLRPVKWYGNAGGAVPPPKEVIEVIKKCF
jgi:2-oxoglutarate ferredoxin oxidoreductase subunit alpha